MFKERNNTSFGAYFTHGKITRVPCLFVEKYKVQEAGSRLRCQRVRASLSNTLT